MWACWGNRIIAPLIPNLDTTGMLIGPWPYQEGKKLQRPNICKSLKKEFGRLSVQPGLRGSNDLRVGRKMATFNCFFSCVGLRTYQQPCRCSWLVTFRPWSLYHGQRTPVSIGWEVVWIHSFSMDHSEKSLLLSPGLKRRTVQLVA